MQDIDKANNALHSLPKELDALSQGFVIVLRQLFYVSCRAAPEHKGGFKSLEGKKAIMLPTLANDIFGNQELDLLNNQDLSSSQDLDFSEWVHS